jgi:hypothetical protein
VKRPPDLDEWQLAQLNAGTMAGSVGSRRLIDIINLFKDKILCAKSDRRVSRSRASASPQKKIASHDDLRFG